MNHKQLKATSQILLVANLTAAIYLIWIIVLILVFVQFNMILLLLFLGFSCFYFSLFALTIYGSRKLLKLNWESKNLKAIKNIMRKSWWIFCPLPLAFLLSRFYHQLGKTYLDQETKNLPDELERLKAELKIIDQLLELGAISPYFHRKKTRSLNIYISDIEKKQKTKA